MVKNLLSFLKKRELPENEYVALGGKHDLYFYMICKTIKPTTIIKDKEVFKITYLVDKYIINGFIVITLRNKIRKVFLNGAHPNCDLKTFEFCLAKDKINAEFNEIIIKSIITNINTYYLDDCYFNPRYKDIKYEKVNSIFISDKEV